MSGRKSQDQTYFNDNWLSENGCEINIWILKGSNLTSFRWKVYKENKTPEEAGK